MSDHRSPLAKARDKWLASDEGQACSNPNILKNPSQRQFLENRLASAFIAGANFFGLFQSERTPRK